MMMMLDTGMPPFLGLEGGTIQGVESESEKMKDLVSKGDWDSVLKLLIKDDVVAINLLIHPMKSSGDTVLHVAASEGQTEVLRKLLGEDLQGIQVNAFGNTTLHLAAANGHAETCRLIIEAAPDLITITNDDGLTPIFLAALTGSYDAFYVLASTSMHLDDAQIALKRGNGGDTILHCALTLENFDLASEIIKKFSKLLYYRNERGLTPLQILANNPSAFRSGCQLGLLDRFFYESISVSTESILIESSEKKKEDYSDKLAGNYLLCWTFFNLLRSAFSALGRSLYPHAPWNDNRETLEPCDSAPSRFRHTSKLRASALFRFRQMALEVILTLLALLGFSSLITKTRKRKLKHVWACNVMHQLLDHVGGDWDFGGKDTEMDPHLQPTECIEDIKTNTALEVGKTPTLEEEIASESETDSTQESQQTPEAGTQPQKRTKRGVSRSVFLIVAQKGVKEMVNAILEAFPMAIRDKDLEDKNVMLLAAEHRQTEIFMLLHEKNIVNWLGQVDVEGNSILHLAAKNTRNEEMLIPGAALQMQREIKWFQFVKKQLPPYFSTLQNHKDQTAMEVFTETHQELAMQRAKWLSKASQSCSVVATLIISVVFATMARPGGLIQEQQDRAWAPSLQRQAGLSMSSPSLVSLRSAFHLSPSSCSLTFSLSPYQDSDNGNNLANKLILGLGFLFISIVAMFLSFFSGDLFVLDSKMKYIAYPIYVLTSCVVLAGFPLYSEYVKMVVTGIPTSTRQPKFSF